MIKYFHEATRKEIDATFPNGATWAEVAEKYPQPIWCKYPKAVRGMMGCWSLMCGYVTGRNYCKNCDCYIKENANPLPPSKEE